MLERDDELGGDDELERMQIKIAFLERANTDLSDVVFRQQQEIRILFTRLAELGVRLDSATREERLLSADEERPPHY